MDESGSGQGENTVRCAECGAVLQEGQDRQATEGGVFCRACFEGLTSQLRQVLDAQGQDVAYGAAVAGGVAGAALGVLAWWGFTVLTHVAFGLVAVVIGIAVGKGVVIGAGNKRHRNLQALSAAISAAGFVYASYLVNRTFIHKAYADRGEPIALPLLPPPELFFRVVAVGFGIMDLVFLAIVLYEAWKIPAPVEIPLGRTA